MANPRLSSARGPATGFELNGQGFYVWALLGFGVEIVKAVAVAKAQSRQTWVEEVTTTTLPWLRYYSCSRGVVVEEEVHLLS